jgi:GH18 family chitinase
MGPRSAPGEGLPGPGNGTLTYQDVFDNYLPITDPPAWDDPTQSTSMYLAADKVWISPQMQRDVVAKATYAVKHNLRGLMLWELSADKADKDSLVGFMATALRNTPS